MEKLYLLGAVCACTMSYGFTANANTIPTQVITFNGTASEGSTSTATGTTYMEVGYSLVIGNAGAAYFVDNNTSGFPGVIDFDDDVLEFNDPTLSSFSMTKDDGELFDLISVETGSLGRDVNDDGSFVFTGIFGSGGTVTQTILGVAPGVTTNLFTGFVGLSSLVVTSNDGHFPVMDNISVASAVPIPAALWLFGSGLLGLIGIARRKKAA